MGTLDGLCINLYTTNWGVGCYILVLDYEEEDLMDEINKGSKIKHCDKWYNIGRYLYVPFAAILSIYALVFKVAY